MKKNQIQNIVIHIVKSSDSISLADRINEFHVQVIEHRLNQSNITAKQKAAVIDRIIENLKAKEFGNINPLE